jgi:hypothetical protein
MGVVEKFKLGDTEIEIFDDCCITEEEIEKSLKEIEHMAIGFFQKTETA